MAENRVPLCSSLWSENCFTFLLVQGKRRKSIPKHHCFQAPAVWAAKHRDTERRTEIPAKGDLAAQGGGTAKWGGAQPKHPCLTGTDECVTWDAQGRKPTKSPARQHPQRASQLRWLNWIPLPPMSQQISPYFPTTRMEEEQFLRLPKQFLTSFARLLQLLCTSTGTLNPKLSWFPTALLGQC